MASHGMSVEWNKLESENLIPSPPKSIEQYRAWKQERAMRAKAMLSDPKFALLADNVDVENTHVEIPELPGHQFPVRVYRPKGVEKDQKLAIMLYFHGGYWCSGTSDSEDLGCRAIVARGRNIIIVSFEYLLAPEHEWKEIFSDAENATKWLAGNASQFGGDPSLGFIIGGAEAGAQLAAISAIRARDRHPHIKLTGQVLIVPTTIAWPDDNIPDDWKERLASHAENANAPYFNEDLYELFVTNLGIPAEEKRKGENFPVWADLKGLPPAYLPMDEFDPIRDQGFLFAELLAEAGGKTRTDYYRGLPNMFVHFPELPTTAVAGIHLSAGIQWLLQIRK